MTAVSVFRSFGRWLPGLLLALLAPGPCCSAQSDWPQFLGPDRNGISSETGLIAEWPAGGLPELWRVPGGVGMSGMVINERCLVTLWQTEGEQKAVALDPASGKKLWETVLAPEYRNAMGDGPRATPVLVEGKVVVYTGEGILVALDETSGSILWQRDLPRELEIAVADYGMACSPLVHDGKVMVSVGSPGATMACVNLADGKLLWKSGDDPAGYSSPAILQAGGREQLVVHSGGAVLGLDPLQGTTLWRYPFETDYFCNIATPLAIDGKVFISSGENHGSALLELEPAGEGFTVREVWTDFGPRSHFRNEWQTAILFEDHLYGLDNQGSAGPITSLVCLRAADGKEVWRENRFGKSNPVFADGMLLFSSWEGELIAVKATPAGYEEIGRQKVTGATRQAPALSRGRIFLRDDREIVCLKITP